MVDVSPEHAKIVLVVDDEEQVRKLTCRILQRAGYGVLSAHSGPEALTLFRSGDPIDLLLTDVEMVGMSGVELGHQINVERPDVRVVLYSGNLAHEADSEFPFLAKPFLPKDLLSFVASALARRPAPTAVEAPITNALAVPGPVAIGRLHPRQRRFLATYLTAAAIVLSLMLIGLQRIGAPWAADTDTVNLKTWRDRGAGAVAKAGHSLILKLNLTGIPRHDSYRIELVDQRGQVIWQQVIPAPNAEVLQARSAALHSGIFFVRAYASPEGLLREYELDIGENP